jgi:hypothetical protein
LGWTGDLVVSIYPLQSSIECPSDIAPNLLIDFSPFNIPVAQISDSYTSLQARGIELSSVPQPVDFVFSNSPVAAGNVIIPNTYYAVTVKRSGSANKCDIMVSTGSDRISNSRITTFTGNLWVDIPEEDLWFQIWTDSAKVSDGQAYDSGHGIILPKTILDTTTQATIDYSLDNLQFVGTDTFRAVVAATTTDSVPIPDQRTGNPVFSRQQFEPTVTLLNTIDITNLTNASEPLVVGAIADKNIKFFDPGNSIINSTLYSSSIVDDELVIRIVDDATDTARYNAAVNSLATNLVNGDFIGTKIFPNNTNSSIYYRIASARLCSMILGDVNGDGIIDSSDLDLLNTYLNYDLNVGLAANSVITLIDGSHTSFVNGYSAYIGPFVSASALSFQLVNPVNNEILAQNIDGILVPNPSDLRLAQFTSAAVNFGAFTGIDGYKLVITTVTNLENYGGFDITVLDTLTDVLTIRKVVLSGDVFAQMMRADIDGNFQITAYDGYLLQSYINREVFTVLPPAPPSPYTGPTSNPYNKIGFPFSVLRFKLEKFIDRIDD